MIGKGALPEAAARRRRGLRAVAVSGGVQHVQRVSGKVGKEGYTMKIQCFPVTMSKEEALAIAAGKGNPLMKAYAGKKKINLRLMYLENRYYIYEITYHDGLLMRLVNKKRNGEQKQKIRVMVEATTCSASYTEEAIHTIEKDVDELAIQEAHYDDERLENCGSTMAKRMVRRRAGREISISTVSMEKVYRPYYIAIYGEMIEGTKARYLPIAADGNEIYKTF